MHKIVKQFSIVIMLGLLFVSWNMPNPEIAVANNSVSESIVRLVLPYQSDQQQIDADKLVVGEFFQQYGFEYYDNMLYSSEPEVAQVVAEVKAQLNQVPTGPHATPEKKALLASGDLLEQVVFINHLPPADQQDVLDFLHARPEFDQALRLLTATPISPFAAKAYPVYEEELASTQATLIEWNHHGGYEYDIVAESIHILGTAFGDCIGTLQGVYIDDFLATNLITQTNITLYLDYIDEDVAAHLNDGTWDATNLASYVVDLTHQHLDFVSSRYEEIDCTRRYHLTFKGVSDPEKVVHYVFEYSAPFECPALNLIKGVNDPTPRPGQRITYTLTIDNNGVVSATNVLISDTLPSGLSLAGPVTLQGTTVITGSTLILVNAITITDKTRVTVTFPVTVGSTVLTGTVLTNIASVSSTEITSPRSDSVSIIVGGNKTYLPIVLRW